MKKSIKFLAIICTLILAVGPLGGCKKNGGYGGGETNNTCEIKVALSGYGVDWATDMANAFNETFKDEGYKVVITMAEANIGVANEIGSPKRNTTDLYLEYGHRINPQMDRSRTVLGANGGALLEDLTDVLDSKPIGLDKQEEGDKTIRERMEPEMVAAGKYSGRYVGFDGVYGLSISNSSVNGILVNTKTLTQKGYTQDDLLTTDKLLAVCSALKPANLLDQDAFFPVAWAAGNAPGYWDYMTQVLFAQYSGKTDYENFWNFIPKTGTTEANGYDVYEDRGIYEALRVVETLEDKDLAVPGTASMDNIGAQARVFTGKSLFCVGGDYVYKEMSKDYSQYLDDVILMKFPVVSPLGVKLSLCGTEHKEGDTCSACDEKLAAIVKAVDEESKTDAEIASETGVDEAKVAQIREARGYYAGNTLAAAAFMPSYSDSKHVAKLFLRFMYSDDGNDIYGAKTYSSLPIKRATPIDTGTLSAREASVYNMTASSNAQPVYAYNTSPLRAVAGVSFAPAQNNSTVGLYTRLSYSHTGTANPDLTAQKAYEANIANAKSNWLDWLQTAGLD